MELSELQSLLADPSKLANTIKELAPELDPESLKFNPETHNVTTIAHRPKRAVEIPTGLVDANGDKIYKTEYRDVHRIPSSTQKQIVDWAVQMALGNPVEIDCKPETEADKMMLAMVEKTLEDNKMDYVNQEIERLKQIYLTVMEVWYSEVCEPGYWSDVTDNASVKFKMRCVVMSPEDGDIIVPIRNQYKDLLATARFYVVKIEGKDINKMDLFLQKSYDTYIEQSGGWELDKTNPIAYGKANIVLHEQKRRETQDVDAKLNRREEIDSDNADENQASGRPLLVATGDIEAVGTRADTGKTFKVENGGDLKYVEPAGAQESIENERKNLLKDIYDETQTPQISFESSSFTGSMPGISIKLMFLPATNKAKSKQQGSIGMSHQRRLNFLKSAMAVINIAVKPSLALKMKPKFSIFLPENETEKYENIVKLVAAGLISKETAIKMIGLVDDPEAEYAKIKAEADEAAKKAIDLAKQNKPVPA
jgi:SPP1 family phage portal protein